MDSRTVNTYEYAICDTSPCGVLGITIKAHLKICCTKGIDINTQNFFPWRFRDISHTIYASAQFYFSSPMHGVYVLWKPRTRNIFKTYAQLIQSFSYVNSTSIKHFVCNTNLKNACAYFQTILTPNITNLICVDCAQSFENQLHIIFVRTIVRHFWLAVRHNRNWKSRPPRDQWHALKLLIESHVGLPTVPMAWYFNRVAVIIPI